MTNTSLETIYDRIIEDMIWAYGFEAQPTLNICKLIADSKPFHMVNLLYIYSMRKAGWEPLKF